MGSVKLKGRIEETGRFLSSLIMPNIAAFIAMGLMSTLFMPGGWLPNEVVHESLVKPVITYLLPMLVGYTGGMLAGGTRGGVVGATATMGAVASVEQPMLFGAMVIGPISGYAIKLFDRLIDGKIKRGFEMLVNNFSAGIIGLLLTLFSFTVIGPLVGYISQLLARGVGIMAEYRLLPFISVLVEPAKIFFLNNVINHGVFSPYGIQRAAEAGYSLFFMIEANPGPGLGVLLSYMVFGRGSIRQTAAEASVIHFFGGIHEVYFPYVLMKPRLLLAVIAGGMGGVLVLLLANAGLVAPPSPGSIITILSNAPKNSMVGVLAAVISATVISFVVSSLLLRQRNAADDDNQGSLGRIDALQPVNRPSSPVLWALDGATLAATPYKVIVACDAGMGSSAMGAGLLSKKIEAAGLTQQVTVTHCAINGLPPDANIIITHGNLTERARSQAPKATHISLTNFMDGQIYTDLVEQLLTKFGIDAATPLAPLPHVDLASAGKLPIKKIFQLSVNDIFVGLEAENKEQAIRFAGEQLVKNGYVKPAYIEAMLVRERRVSTYLGESVAVPHGTVEAKEQILATGVVICQYPRGVPFGEHPDEVAHLVIAIAARNDEHVQLLAQLTTALDDPALIKKLTTVGNVEEILFLLTRKAAA